MAGSSAAQNAPGQALGHKKAAIQGWLGQEPVMTDRRPVLCRGRRPLRGLPMEPSCQAGRPGRLTGEGEAPVRED